MNKNTWLAFAICVIIYLVWFEYVMPYFVPPPAKKEEKAAPTQETATTKQATTPETVSQGPATPTTAVKEAAAEEKIILDAPDLLLKTEWTNVGAALNKLILKDYYTDITHKENVTLLEPLQDTWRTLGIIDPRARATSPDKQRAALPLDKTRYEITERTDHKVSFRATFSNGLEVTKTFEVEPQKYHVLVHITLRNLGKEPLQQAYTLIAPAGIVPDQTSYMSYLTAQIAVDLRAGDQSIPLSEHPVEIAVKSPDQLNKETEKFYQVQRDVAWTAVANNYFAVIVRPEQTKSRWLFAATTYPLVTKPLPVPPGHANAMPPINVLTELTTNLFDIRPGSSVTQDYLFYAGPKRSSVLKEYGNFLRVLDYDYGMFGAITKLFLWLLGGIYSIIPNFGVGIILLTLLVKIVLHPLSRKSQVSMYKMQKLQPKINALREKYKHDQKTLGQEQWKLFREHRVNPLGGCLPMFLQIPVLIALYNGIAYSIEFRQQPFVGWIHDLAQPDKLMTFPFYIPLLGNHLNVLPIIMVATWMIQQMTMPKPVDPQQAQQQKIMMFMPIVFGFLFYSMPSGLVLYWLVNTVLGIIEQYYIKKTLAKIEID